MADQLQLRGGTAAQNNVFTGAQREATINTDDHSLVIHDGVTPGGFPTASRAQVNNGTFYFNDDTVAGSAANAYILAAKSNTNRPTQYLDGQQFGFVTANANTGASNANFSGLGVKNLKYPGGVDPAAGDIFGRVYLIYDAANDWLEIQRKASGPPPQIRSVTAAVSSNTLTASILPCNIDFRSSSLGNGAITTRTITSTISVAALNGSTLGTQSGVASRIVILAINGPSGAEVALINANGGLNLDETSLISTTAIGASSNSSNVAYSTTARTNVAFRVMGYIDSTQVTAGAWASTPTQVQGQGGQTIIGAAKVGYSNVLPTTSGTAIDFTSIPSWVKKITVILGSVSTNGTSVPIIQIGTSSGVETTAYSGAGSSFSGGTVGSFSWSTGAPIEGAGAANFTYSGVVRLTFLGGTSWIIDVNVGNVAVARNSVGAGIKTLASQLDRIRLTTISGADSFDLGSASIIYEG